MGGFVLGETNTNTIESFVLKADIRRYFDTVDHEVLIDQFVILILPSHAFVFGNIVVLCQEDVEDRAFRKVYSAVVSSRCMGTIVAIGGGSIRTGSTLAIDREIIRLSGKKNPTVLFLPTASSDSEKYWQIFRDYYGKKLGCRSDVLFLLKEKPSFSIISRKILSADIIYVGGGNTLKMMRRWRFLGVDTLLRKAWKQGTVLAGVSAGSICWFEYGHSDSLSFYNPKHWEYIRVKGLGFIKGTHCPHYNSSTLGVKRKHDFTKMMLKNGGKGIAVDNNCAVIFSDRETQVMSTVKGAAAYCLYRKNGKVLSGPAQTCTGDLPRVRRTS